MTICQTEHYGNYFYGVLSRCVTQERMIRKSISLHVPPISIEDVHHGEIVGDPSVNKYVHRKF